MQSTAEMLVFPVHGNIMIVTTVYTVNTYFSHASNFHELDKKN